MNKRKKIRIGIDARFYGPKQKGLGRYVQKLIENLEKNDLNNEYVIFLRKENWDKYQSINPNFKKILADYQWYTFTEQIFMPFKIMREKVDLMHFPHFNVPIFCPVPFVITIHDLILKRFQTRRASTLGFIKYWIKNMVYQLVILFAVKRASKIIAVSNFTKKDILKYFRVKSKKIKVIYEGVSENLDKQRPCLENLRPLQRPYFQGTASNACPRIKYLLYVGNAYPHKNLERLILAFNKILKEEKDLKLILVGELDYFYKRLQKISSSNVIFTDFVSDEELSNLYQNARLYIFPSLCEGFGLPPLEAMAYNLPVVSSNSSCLPEILGDAAVYFNAENIDDMVDKIKLVLNNEELQKELISKGREQIGKYSWEKMSKEILDVYVMWYNEIT